MNKRDQLGNFELMVILVRLGDSAYGVPISEELEKRTGRDVAIGSVYTLPFSKRSANPSAKAPRSAAFSIAAMLTA